jgi:hypothetical protein
LEITMDDDDVDARTNPELPPSKTRSVESKGRRGRTVIDMPTRNGRPITLVTAPEAHDRDPMRFWDGAATFWADWRREMDGAEMGPRMRIARGTLEPEIAPLDDTDLVTALNAALEAIDPAHEDADPPSTPRRKRALSPTVEVDAELDDDDSGSGEAAAPPSNDPPRSSWLGVATSQPHVGASLVIDAGNGGQFVLTSAVSLITPHDGGMLVQTRTNNVYFVAHSRDTFLVEWADAPDDPR